MACGHKWPGHFLATWGGLADSLIGSQIEDQLSDLNVSRILPHRSEGVVAHFVKPQENADDTVSLAKGFFIY